ncbi:MAG TPA: hypothetical protein VFB14_24045 [Bryobacteraceae bacterium]|jgi:hypothetical protein|nr:hypothetical protein [Bryobacteraceae bacterium]
MAEHAAPLTKEDVSRRQKDYAESAKSWTRGTEDDLRHVELNGKPLYQGPDTTVPTPELDAAIKQFQTSIGIEDKSPKMSGVIGRDTMQALAWIRELTDASNHVKAGEVNTINGAIEAYGGDEASITRDLKELVKHNVDLSKFGIVHSLNVDTPAAQATTPDAKGPIRASGRGGPG